MGEPTALPLPCSVTGACVARVGGRLLARQQNHGMIDDEDELMS